MRAARSAVRGVGRTTLVSGAALILAGCGASTSGTADQPSATSSSSEASSPSVLLGPARFAEAVDSGDRFVINVHVPDEGSIAGTEAAIPFDQLEERSGELPTHTSTPLALYCRSASMSATASATLRSMGHTDIVELRGGMKAWTASGRTLLRP